MTAERPIVRQTPRDVMPPTDSSPTPDGPAPTFTAAEVRSEWDDFTQSEAEEVAGRTDLLVAALQDKFGLSADEAARQVQDFLDDGDSTNQSA